MDAGINTSTAEVTHVSTHGLWILLGDEGLFLPYADFPWFKGATIEELSQVEMPTQDHLYWPMLDRAGEIAFDLHPNYWGKGIATSVCRDVVSWGLAVRRYVRIQATTVDTNTRSQRVLERCGFKPEGKLRNFRMVRGTPRDFLIFSAVAD